MQSSLQLRHAGALKQGRTNPAFSWPCLCLSDTRHFRDFRSFRERNLCFQWVMQIRHFAVFVKTAPFWQGTKTRFTKNTVCATPRCGMPLGGSQAPASFWKVPGLPRISPNFLGSSSATSPELPSLWVLRAIQRFFVQKFSQASPEVPRTSAQVTLSDDSQKVHLGEKLKYHPFLGVPPFL